MQVDCVWGSERDSCQYAKCEILKDTVVGDTAIDLTPDFPLSPLAKSRVFARIWRIYSCCYCEVPAILVVRPMVVWLYYTYIGVAFEGQELVCPVLGVVVELI